jgi:hypothetical protein
MNQDRNKAWGFSLFGDDLRQETAGKISLMGLYQDDMIFHGERTFPLALPKFAILILYYELVNSIQADITFKVSHDIESNLIAEVPILRKNMPTIQDTKPESESSEDGERILHARIPIIISPFVVEKAGRLRVRAHYSDGNILKLGSLWIKHMTTKEFEALLATNAQKESKTN